MKLVIGTAQFGSQYGLANKSGELSENEIKKIIKFAIKFGINELDTAVGYGNSEKKLGAMNINDMSIITKIPRYEGNRNNLKKWMIYNVQNSCNKLGVNKLHGLLLHSPNQLQESIGDEIYLLLKLLKEQGFVENIGVSIYNPSELDIYFKEYDFDIVQTPFNVLDTRIRDSGWLNKLKKKGVKVYVRSIFLQGLLLFSQLERDPYFAQWDELNYWDKWLYKNKIQPLDACIKFVRAEKRIDKIIVGVDSLYQLQQIYNSFKKIPIIPDFDWGEIDETLISPQKWSI